MNFESGTPLAFFQDKLIKQAIQDKSYFLNEEDFRRLNTNMWVTLAGRIAPNNLVIRHLCLQDIFNGKREHLDEINRLFNLLAPYRLWLEGYSYWLYSKYILMEWGEKYHPTLINQIKQVDENFAKTSYRGHDGLLYPAPFGDLRLQHLEEALLNIIPEDGVNIFPVCRMGITYKIKAAPLGGNTHTPIKNDLLLIKEGLPEGFKFYEGYDKKYKNGFEEFLDLIRPRRLISMLYLLKG